MNEISDNLFSAFLEGNISAEDTMRVLEAARKDPELRKAIELCMELEAEEAMECEEVLPMQALAAKETANRCAVMCELYILKQHGVERTIGDWEKQSQKQGWLKEGGTAIHNIGRLLEQECFSSSRTFHNSIQDLQSALKDHDVIVVVDGKELTTNVEQLNREKLEDDFIGSNPNHAIVIKSVDDDIVTYYEPESDEIKKIPLELFDDAWEDSSRYMVKVSPRDFSKYEPHPIDLSDVSLPEELIELREAIAENAHEVWAAGRKSQGWTYGSERNDTLKQTPDMIPYSDLTDDEKFFDREMAMNTIKLLKKLGYKISKE